MFSAVFNICQHTSIKHVSIIYSTDIEKQVFHKLFFVFINIALLYIYSYLVTEQHINWGL